MVQIELDKPRRLHFGLKEFEDLEKAMDGKALGEIVNQISTLSITAIVRCLCFGLRHDDQAMTTNLARKLVDEYLKQGHQLITLATAIVDAIQETGVFRTEDDEPGKLKTEAPA